MTFKEIQEYARQLLRDVNRTIFQEIEITRTINEGVDRMRSVPELRAMRKLTSPDEEPILVPEEFHHLLSLYSASRCFFQDEQFTQSATLMNEFESKFFELKDAIQNGDIVIKDENSEAVETGENQIDAVKNVYFKTRKPADFDEVIIF